MDLHREKLACMYERMRLIYGNTEKQLRECLDNGNLVAAEELIGELGKEALAENGDWVLLHRERPPEMR